MTAIIGPMIDNGDVEAAALATINYWIDMYLGQKERLKGWTVGQLARPNGYIASYDKDNWPEIPTPAIIANCPGTIETLRYGNGVGAWFEVNVDAVIVDTTEEIARSVASAYASTIAVLLEQQPLLMGSGDEPLASDCLFQEWKLELPDEENRTLAVATCMFHVKVDEIFNPRLAPLPPPLPSSEAAGDYPTADTVNVTLTEHPSDGDVSDSNDPGTHTDTISIGS